METKTESAQVAASAKVFSQAEVLSIASSVIRTYPNFTSAYLSGPYDKNIALRPDSVIDIILFLPGYNFATINKLDWNQILDTGGVFLDLATAFHKRVGLKVYPPEDLAKEIKAVWVPIDIKI